MKSYFFIALVLIATPSVIVFQVSRAHLHAGSDRMDGHLIEMGLDAFVHTS